MPHILTLGMAVVDFVMSVDEMPSLAEKYRANDAHIIGGGCAANAAVAIAKLGGEVSLAARLGGDQIGQMILAELKAANVQTEQVKTFPNCRSSFSNVLLDQHGERQIVNFRDANLPAEAGWVARSKGDFGAVMADTRWAEGALAAMQFAKARNIPGVMDAEAPIGEAEAALMEASHVIFSAQGLREYEGNDDLTAALFAAAEKLGGFVAYTDGGDGIFWIEEGQLKNQKGFDIKPIDTLGAGDIWHGSFAYFLALDFSLKEAILHAHATAAMKCTRRGGRETYPTYEEIQTFIKDQRLCN